MAISPFSDGDARLTFDNLKKRYIDEIRNLDNEYVLRTSPAELEDFYFEQVRINPLVLHVDKKYIASRVGTEVDVGRDFNRFFRPGIRPVVPGTRLDIAIPYEGDKQLWSIRPSSFSISGYHEIEVQDDLVLLSFVFPDDTADPEKLKQQIEREVSSFAGVVDSLRHDVENHNTNVLPAIKQALEQKRERALAVIKAVEGLNIPMKQRNEPLTFILPTKRREFPAKRPVATTSEYKAEPMLGCEDYEHILKVMKSMSLVVERNPASFKTLKEPAIRDHFLIQLNGHYEGCATGETFNASGKTDILIRIEDRNIFIVECKFWRGAKKFSEAIDQLLSYLSWRDCKCAIVVFNKTKDSSAIHEKMHSMMESHSGHRKTLTYDPNSDSKYVFVKESDPGKEIIITTQLFDLTGDTND